MADLEQIGCPAYPRKVIYATADRASVALRALARQYRDSTLAAFACWYHSPSLPRHHHIGHHVHAEATR